MSMPNRRRTSTETLKSCELLNRCKSSIKSKALIATPKHWRLQQQHKASARSPLMILSSKNCTHFLAARLRSAQNCIRSSEEDPWSEMHISCGMEGKTIFNHQEVPENLMHFLCSLAFSPTQSQSSSAMPQQRFWVHVCLFVSSSSHDIKNSLKLKHYAIEIIGIVLTLAE